jgi:hypothetical protein
MEDCDSFCFSCGRAGHLPADCQAFSSTKFASKRPRDNEYNLQQQLQKRTTTQPNSTPQQQQQQHKSDGVTAGTTFVPVLDKLCVYCGRMGHHQAVCPEVMCYNCMSRMHPTRICTELPSSMRVRLKKFPATTHPEKLAALFSQCGIVKSIEHKNNSKWIVEFSRTYEALVAKTMIDEVGEVNLLLLMDSDNIMNATSASAR